MNLSSALGERDERSIIVGHLPSEMRKRYLTEYYAFFGEVKLATIIEKFKRAYVCFATTEQVKIKAVRIARVPRRNAQQCISSNTPLRL